MKMIDRDDSRTDRSAWSKCQWVKQGQGNVPKLRPRRRSLRGGAGRQSPARLVSNASHPFSTKEEKKGVNEQCDHVAVLTMMETSGGAEGLGEGKLIVLKTLSDEGAVHLCTVRTASRRSLVGLRRLWLSPS
jgi:hypothetical protein